MARGWESKSVESQIESAESKRAGSEGAHLTTEQMNKLRQRESLQLSRTRVLHDLESATHQRYRETLQAALQHLDEKLALLG